MSDTFYSWTKKAPDGSETTRKISNRAVGLIALVLVLAGLWYFDVIQVGWLMSKLDVVIDKLTK